MTRTTILLGAALLAGCDRPAPEPQAATNSAFDNEVAGRSIIQPQIAAANPPEPEPTPTPAPPPTTLTLPFGSGAALSDDARGALDRFLVGIPPSARLAVRGHSDSSGNDLANLSQSRRRAEAVRDYLVAHGIAADRIAVIALGERRPVAPNANLDGSDDPAGRARNRRVEIEVLPDVAVPPAEPTPTPIAGSDGNSATP